MPQMSPLLWLNLFMMITSAFVVFMAFNYFTKVPSSLPAETVKSSSHSIDWKW